MIQPDYAIRQFLHRRFVPRPGVDRVGRRFDLNDIPAFADGTRSYEAARKAQSLFVLRCVVKYTNPSDDVYEVETEKHQRCHIRMWWLRLYFQEVGR